MVRSFRDHHGIFAVNGIFFHHESPRRHRNFLSKKVVHGAVQIKLGLAQKLTLGNLKAARDWGYAPEYMEAAEKMLIRNKPEDFVIATGESHSVEELVAFVFEQLDLDWKNFVTVDSSLSRSYEVSRVCGDPSKANAELGWNAKTKLKDLLKIMVDGEISEQSAGKKIENLA